MDSYERVLGCFYGAAIGDAMGAATETMTPQMILDRYGAYVDQLLAPGDGTFGAGCRPASSRTIFPWLILRRWKFSRLQTAPSATRRRRTRCSTGRPTRSTSALQGPAPASPSKRFSESRFPSLPVVLACDNSRASNGSAMKIFPAGLKNPGHPERAVQDAITLCKPTHDNAASLSAACAIAAGRQRCRNRRKPSGGI